MSQHPSPKTLQRLLRGELSPERTLPVVLHLVRGCSVCVAAAKPHVEPDLFKDDDEEWLEPDEPDEVDAEAAGVYDAVIDRGLGTIGGEIRAALAEAQLIAEAYRVLVEGGLPAFLGHPRLYDGPVACLAVLRRSQDFADHDPHEMVELAWFADFSADNLDPKQWGRQRVADLRTLTAAELGNAHRAAGDLEAADRAMVIATERFHESSQDPPLAARLASLQASLLGAQRHFREALSLLERAETTYREIGETGEAVHVLVKRGLYAGYAGDAEAAVEILTDGVALLEADPDTPPKELTIAVHNLAWMLMECERWSRSRELLWRTERLYEQHAGPVMLLKRIWLDARISAGLEHLETADKGLAAAIRGLEQAGLGYPAAIASLDRAAVWLRLGRSRDAAALVIQTVETFLALGIGREVFASIRLLQQAAELGALTTEMLRHATRLLLRFEDRRD